MDREYATLKALNKGETIIVEGRTVHQIDGKIEAGDLYVAEKNTGPKLLIAARVNVIDGWIHPISNDYSYDIYECVRVEENLEPENKT